MSTQYALAQVQALVSVYLPFFLSQMCFYLYDFYSNDLVLDHVIKLFIVLYRALKHGDLGWMLCVCLDCGVIIIIIIF